MASLIDALEKVKGIKSVEIGAYRRLIEEIKITLEDGRVFVIQSGYDVKMEVPHITISDSPAFSTI